MIGKLLCWLGLHKDSIKTEITAIRVKISIVCGRCGSTAGGTRWDIK